MYENRLSALSNKRAENLIHEESSQRGSSLSLYGCTLSGVPVYWAHPTHGQLGLRKDRAAVALARRASGRFVPPRVPKSPGGCLN
jgi:hypothetical protein